MASKETIRFNVNDLGRKYRGQARKFDVRGMAALINSPDVQERVANRDMLGYYGHWQRMKFGLMPPETAIVDGKTVNIEPAIVTTYLRADADGNVEHQTEFLDTAAGKIAARLHGSRTGGFSTAVFAEARGGLDYPTVFAGFDYVLEPNNTRNRGYLFDSVGAPNGSGGDGAIFDFVLQDFNQGNAAMSALYDSLQSDHTLALQAMQKIQEENEELLSLLASGGAVFDSARGARAPVMVDSRALTSFTQRSAMFKTASLAALEKLPDPEGDEFVAQASRHWGIS